MKPSYLLGILLILVTAFSNMAMAQLSPSLEKYTPESIKKRLKSKPPVMRSAGGIAPTSVRPLQPDRSSNTDTDRPLRLLLERKAHPEASPAQSMANVSRSSYAAQPMKMKGRIKKSAFTPQQIDQKKAAERETIRAEMLSRVKRKH